MAIAVLGGGILGVCTALELADRGYRVVLFERNSELVSEASLHNEGKLHLGFVYAADPSFRTAQRMIDGASRFMATLRRWVPEAGIQALPARPFDYVVHRETMTTVCQIEAHFARVAGSVEKLRREQPLAGACDPARPPWRRLDDDELAARYSPEVIVAAYETCEVAVDAWVLAQHLRAAARAQPRIELVMNAKVERVDAREGAYDVVFEQGAVRRDTGFQGVVNALWANRPAIDERSGLKPRGRWYTRRKLGVVLPAHGARMNLPNVTVMLGPFGDVVTYQSGRVYLSWYPVCMIGVSTGSEETDWSAALREVDLDEIRRGTITALAEICPAVRALEGKAAGEFVVNGGSIFALGRSDIVDPQSQLHERFITGIDERGAYLSVDTAKFTLGPAMALAAADRVSALAGPPS